MSKVIHIVQGGVAINAVILPDEAVISSAGLIAEWDGDKYEAPEGCSLCEQEGAAIGWKMKGRTLVAPPEPAAEPAPLSISAYDLLLFAGAKLEQIKPMDQLRLASRGIDRIPVDSPILGRISKAFGKSPPDLIKTASPA